MEFVDVGRQEAKDSVGAGWSSIIDKLYDRLPPEVKVLQVKEKFGLLRVYTSPHLDWLDELETESASMCEMCGTTEDVETSSRTSEGRPGYWIKTLCGPCRKVRYAKST